jgi:crotonobetainyl-CoA:carnitine CoA-transferase CaiB-like acyl-CoA transferase
VVIDNNSNGVLEKLGLGFEELKQIKPDLVLFGSTGFGNSGPDSSHISWGPNLETLSGLSNLSGPAHRECTMTQFAYPDPLAALHGLFAVLAALDYRRRSGHGQEINMSQTEATIAALGDVLIEVFANDSEPQALANASRNYAPQGCYRCLGEDRWCAITVSTETEWQQLCAVMDKAEWLADSRFVSNDLRLQHRRELDDLIEQWTVTRDPHDVMNGLQEAGVAAGVVQTVEDQYYRDPHLNERGFFETIPHLVKGEVVAAGIPLGLTLTPGNTTEAGKPIGSDNQAVFCDLLGLTQAQFSDFVAAAVSDPIISLAAR